MKSAEDRAHELSLLNIFIQYDRQFRDALAEPPTLSIDELYNECYPDFLSLVRQLDAINSPDKS